MAASINPKLLDVVRLKGTPFQKGETPRGTVVELLGGPSPVVLVEVIDDQGIPLAFVPRKIEDVTREWEAVRLVREPTETTVPEARQHFENGMLFLQNGLSARAKEEFSRSFSLDPKLRGTLLNTTNLLAARGSLASAIVVYAMLLELNPEYQAARDNLSISYMNWGITLAQSGSVREAIDALFLALTIGPSAGTVEAIHRNLVATFTQQGIFHSNSNQYELAYQCFQRAVELDPSELSRKNLAVAMIALSTVKTPIRTLAAREESFRQPLLMGLSVSDCLNAYGAALAGLEEIKEARVAFESALQADPQNRVARHNLDLICRQGSPEGVSVGVMSIEVQPPVNLRS